MKLNGGEGISYRQKDFDSVIQSSRKFDRGITSSMRYVVEIKRPGEKKEVLEYKSLGKASQEFIDRSYSESTRTDIKLLRYKDGSAYPDLVDHTKGDKKIQSSCKPVADVNFYKNLVHAVLSNRMSENSAIRIISRHEDCNEGYARHILNGWMKEHRDTLVKSDAEIAEIQKEFDVDGNLDSWADDYMPGSGKANTKGGELVRAAQRILTEYYNSGNMIGRGMGNETVNPAARYIVEKTSFEGNGEIEDFLNHIVQMDDSEYDSWLKRFQNDFEDWLRGHGELFSEPNDDDMTDYADEEDKDFFINKFYIKDENGNEYYFEDDGEYWKCVDIQFAEDSKYVEDDVIKDGDVLADRIERKEEYGSFEDNGFTYDWEAVGGRDENNDYTEWRFVRVGISEQPFEIDDTIDLDDIEDGHYEIFDVNGNELRSEDFLKV